MAVTPSMEIDIHANIGLVRPGDKLVVAVGRRMSQAEVAEGTERLEAQLPGVEIVFTEGESLAVYRS